MKEFDYIIIGGGCAGLSLAYELEINDKLKEKTLAIIETREEYKRDKTWSFWKVFNHNFDDCVIKSWNNFTINSPDSSHELTNEKFPYQSIDSGKFYKKINSKLSTNSNISFFKNLSEINSENSIIFNSVHEKELDKSKLWQHFQGIEIETPKNIFDEEIINLMDFNCDQRNDVHFFYTLPFSKNKALIETTWLSNLEDQSLTDYDLQLENYVKNNLVGFDADIMARLAEMLGVKLELVKVGSPDRIPFVATGKIDIVMGALTRNYKRQKIVDYTVPVHTEDFGALTTSKKPFAAVMDMNRDDVKLAQVRGSMPAGWAKKNLTKAKITLFDNYPDAMRAIAQGRADAIVDVVDFLGEHMNKYKDVKWQVVDKAIDTWYCGIGVKKGNASLQQWLNVALYTLHRADFVDETWEKWFGIRQIHSVQPQPYF